MSQFVNSTVPFITVGNRRALTDEQLARDRYLAEFRDAFHHCFERDDVRYLWFFIEPDDPKLNQRLN